MIQTYTGEYADAFGRESIEIVNDGERLRTILRGFAFVACSFDDLTPSDRLVVEASKRFTLLTSGELCDYVLTARVPQILFEADREVESWLDVELRVGPASPKGGVAFESLKLALSWGQQGMISTGEGGDFEAALVQIQGRLPNGLLMKHCFGCRFSDYFVAGNGLFGDMACFKNVKEAYLCARTKHEFIAIWEKCDRQVQETFLCSEFEQRAPGTGYRGSGS